MKIEVNNTEKQLNLDSCKTLKDVVTALQGHVPPDSIVTRMVLNGAELTEDQEANTESISLDQIETLEVFTATIREVSLESIQNASGQLGHIVDEVIRTAGFFRYKDESEANKRLVTLVEILQKFVNLLDLVKESLKIDFSSITTDEISLSELQQNLTDTFNKILTSQQDKDWITVADLLEFELAPLLDTWSKVVPTLACPDGKPN